MVVRIQAVSNRAVLGNIALRGYKVTDRGVVGGNPIPVIKITASDLLENGGNFKVGGLTQFVYEVENETPLGGAAVPIYIVNDTPPVPIPNAPSNLVLNVISQSQINLTWDDNSTNETGFRVYRDGGLIDTLPAGTTAYNSTGLTANTSYTYWVTAFNAGGASAPSNTEMATTLPNIPNAPTLSDGGGTDTTVDLLWLDLSDNETGFNIYQDTVLIDTVAANETSYQVTGLAPGTQYDFYVTAFNIAGESDPSNTITHTTDPTEIIFDTFNEAGNVLLTAHAIAPTNVPGNGYVNLGGSLLVIGASDTVVLNSPGVGTVTDAEVADCTVTCSVTISNTNNNPHGLIFRAQDSTNYWFAGYRGNSSQSMRIQKIEAGVTTIESQTLGNVANGTYTFKITLAGNAINFYVNDVLQATVNSSFLNTATRYGFQASNTTVVYDNFRITIP